MLNELLKIIRKYDMVQPGDTVVCAVSGGADSVALLFGMYLLKEKLSIDLCAAHFNHHLRGEESDRDEIFVRNLCDRYDIPLYLGGEYVQTGEKGLEAAARDARYRFLNTLPGKIATAHTADDNAETVLMHLIRGTSLHGLGGIRPIRGNIIRPMLTVNRQQVIAFLDAYNLHYVEDSSNHTDLYLRNRIRHRIMPLLKEENPKISHSISALAMRLQEDEKALHEEMDFSTGLHIHSVLQLPSAKSSRVIKRFLEYCGVPEPESAHIRQADGLMRSSNPSAYAVFPGKIRICRQYDRLIKAEPSIRCEEAVIHCPGVTQITQWGLCVSAKQADSIINTLDVFTVSIKGTVVVRHRLPGDTMRMQGGTKLLKKLFIDLKIPAAARMQLPVLADDQGVLAVYGIGVNLDRIPLEGMGTQFYFQKLTDNKS